MVRHAVLKNLYETEKTIGTGGFAKVKLATHLLTGERVAIKIMDKELLGDDLPRVKMEVDALKTLSHHHICKLFEIIETETHFFLVMEYCPGGELFDHIVQCSRLSEMDSRIFFRQILSAVAYLHSKGFVHRDIKPENVLLDKDQCVKLIDFGLCAKPSPAIDSYLDTACGSPTYAAPELIKGDKYLGAAVDVWSMGVMLYALLCGCLPFDSEKIDSLYKQITSGKYPTPDHLSEGSRKILKDMLQTDPTKRVTVEELLCHPWVQVGYKEPVTFKSLYDNVEKDVDCLNLMAKFYQTSAEDLWGQVCASDFDHNSATYQLLLYRKKQGLPLNLGQYVARTARGRLQSMRRTIVNGNSESYRRGTYIVIPRKTRNQKTNLALIRDQTVKENVENKMQLPENTPVRMIRKRPRSPNRDVSASPAPKKPALPASGNLTPPELKTVKKTSGSMPNSPVQRPYSPSSRFINSIERKLKSVRKVLTPKRKSLDPAQPTVLTAKNMCNISTTSSSNPEQVKEELVRALNSRGIECQCKGFSVRGKLLANGKCKLSFELEVCFIPTTANLSGSVVGIRRKRLKGDAWSYKRVCEEVLNMAGLK